MIYYDQKLIVERQHEEQIRQLAKEQSKSLIAVPQGLSRRSERPALGSLQEALITDMLANVRASWKLQATCSRNARHLPEPAYAPTPVDCSAKYHPSQIHNELLASIRTIPFKALLASLFGDGATHWTGIFPCDVCPRSWSLSAIQSFPSSRHHHPTFDAQACLLHTA